MVRFSLNIKTFRLCVIWEKQDHTWAKILCIPKSRHSRAPMQKNHWEFEKQCECFNWSCLCLIKLKKRSWFFGFWFDHVLGADLNITPIVRLFFSMYRHCFPLPSRHPFFICPVLTSFPSNVQRNCLCLGLRAKLQEHWLVHFIVRINDVR